MAKKRNDGLKIESIEILRVNSTKYGIFTDMKINGICIYGMKYMYKSGKNGYEFFSFPSREGKDGKYYNVVWAYVDDDNNAKMIKAFNDYCDEEDIEIE